MSKRRELITRITDLYRWRGSIYGIKLFVRIYTGISPTVIEPFNTGWTIGLRSTVGENTRLYGRFEDPHSFHVTINAYENLSEDQQRKLMAIVRAQKPAHTRVIFFGWHISYFQVRVRATVGQDLKIGG